MGENVVGSHTHLFYAEKLMPTVGVSFPVENGRMPVCLCETLTSPGGFPNYKLGFLAPSYSYMYMYISHFNRAGIPISLRLT